MSFLGSEFSRLGGSEFSRSEFSRFEKSEFLGLSFPGLSFLDTQFCRPWGGSFQSFVTRRCKTLCFTLLNSTRSPQSHPCLHGFFYCCCFISAYTFHNYLSLYGSWQKK